LNRWSGVALGGILLVGALLRMVGLGTLALIGDESYYWLWSRHLDWAYHDNPAGIALLVRISTALGGQSESGVRWLNALAGVMSVLFVFAIGRRMFSWRAGAFAATVVAVGAPYLITSRFVYSDTLHLSLLLINLYFFWALIESPAPTARASLAFGVSLALLFNTKYSALLYAAALALVVLIDQRRLLRAQSFWVGVAIGMLGLLPIVTWNTAHDWVSVRWQLSHATFNVGGDSTLLGNAAHAVAYLTWPLVLLALLGLAYVRGPAERLLAIVALFMIMPVALSLANSPRNLSTGLVLLLLLAGARLPQTPLGRREQSMTALLIMGLLFGVLYGVGTIVSLDSPGRWPHSSVVAAIRQDAAGWRELGAVLTDQPGSIFALDYSIASQIQYYARRPAQTAWNQYRIWGIPEFEDATIVSLEYLSPTVVSSRLNMAFDRVEGPQSLSYAEYGATKEVQIWEAEGLQLDQVAFLEMFDFLTLLEASR
jgi:hypothetical protein